MQWYGIWCGCFIIFIFWVGFYLKWYGIWRGCIIFIFLVGISFKFYWQIISCALCGLCDMSCLHNWLKFSVVMTSMICSIQSLKDCCFNNWLKFSVIMKSMMCSIQSLKDCCLICVHCCGIARWQAILAWKHTKRKWRRCLARVWKSSLWRSIRHDWISNDSNRL